MKFYIAFSIHGTNKFRVLVKNVKLTPIHEVTDKHVQRALGPDFSIARSRRQNYDAATDGVKLHWKGLLTQEGKPMKSASWVSRRLRELLSKGWTEVQPNPCTH